MSILKLSDMIIMMFYYLYVLISLNMSIITDHGTIQFK